ncbi:MAG: hypothetical protein ACYC4N_16340, partial [Pirellulaceae bacterium]
RINVKYGEFCARFPCFTFLRFVSSFCGSLFVNLRFNWILGQMPVNGYHSWHGVIRGTVLLPAGSSIVALLPANAR